jgi:16S rRNA (guanine527-N7)-methyltransferase
MVLNLNDRLFLLSPEYRVNPGRNALEAILQNCGISLPATQLDSLWRYHQLLRAANDRLNLTRIHNFENMVLKHYVDSLLILNFLELPSPLIDMGSGAGLPGIPLKIARPKTRMILAESRGARAAFLREVCAQLGLDGIEVFPRKLGPGYPGQASGVVSRAVGSIPETLEIVASCLVPGGSMIFMKGPDCEPEIEEAKREQAQHFKLVSDHAYKIPGTTHQRRLLVYERLTTSALSPPRRFRSDILDDSRARDVSSESNASFRLFRELLTGRGVRKHGQALIAGPRVIAEVQNRFADQVQAWITDSHGTPPASTVSTWYRLSSALFKELDVAGTNSPLLLVNVPPIPDWSDDEPWPEGCTLFIPFQDPENVGAVIRSAAAFGVSRVVLLREAAHPFHPKSSRAAGTALFQVPLFQGPSIKELGSTHVPMIALDTTGPELSAERFPARFGLIVGVEGPGISDRLRQGQRRRIAMADGVESLNAATAAGIALYAWATQRAKKR